MAKRKKKRVLRKYTELGQAIADVTGLTQAALAKKMKVSQQTVSKKLRGECAISAADLTVLRKRCKLAVSLTIGDVVVAL